MRYGLNAEYADRRKKEKGKQGGDLNSAVTSQHFANVYAFRRDQQQCREKDCIAVSIQGVEKTESQKNDADHKIPAAVMR